MDDTSNDILNLYIVNTLTGRVLFNSFISSVSFNHPINLICDDNSVFVSYYNSIVNYYYKIYNYYGIINY